MFAADARVACQVHPSPNCGERKQSKKPSILVLHYTGMETAKAALDWLCARESEVSSHYLIDEDGAIVQLVPEAARAWHAGQSSWRGETDINSASIGIEIVNPGHELGYRAFPAVQIEAVTALSRDIASRHGIEPRNIVAHSDIAPTRKRDPGELFPWDQLAENDVGYWIPPVAIREGNAIFEGANGEIVAALQGMLQVYGYGIEVSGDYCALTTACVTAFQRHFRPARVDGHADVSTVATLSKMIAGLG